MKRLAALVILLGLVGLTAFTAMAETAPAFQIHETPSGVRYGLWGRAAAEPAPVLIVLSATIEESLGQAYFRQCGNALANEHGFLCVSIDLPAHGPQQRPDERAGLEGWRDRTDRQENFVAANNARLRAVLDHLIATGQADPARIAACGTSRGGFMALQYAASDPRVKCVAAFAPVTDLTALREFKGAEADPLVASLALIHQAEALVVRPVWLVIGDRDERVSTEAAIAFVRAVTVTALKAELNPQAEIHVLPEPKGHTTPAGAPEAAAAWILLHLIKP
ncbi:MAG: alpha/beta fold hydrolase [Cephaloticoccus sp.]|nr:alpha/beta fold hydrolase [Cephaloticoccus sp.]